MIFPKNSLQPLLQEIKNQRSRIAQTNNQDPVSTVLNTLQNAPCNTDNRILVRTLVELTTCEQLSPAVWTALTPCAQQTLMTILQAFMRNELAQHFQCISQLQQRYSYES